jgi:hypothetical protein
MSDGSAAATDAGAQAAIGQARTLLVEGESIVASALQHRLYALLHRRKLAVATSGRLIFMKRPLLGGYEPLTIRWQDLKEATLSVGMFTASLTIAYSANVSDTAIASANFQSLTIRGLRIEPAQAVYRFCQEQEQSWREKRRLRSIEEMRAKAGGTQIANVLPPAFAPGAPALDTPAPAPDHNLTQRLAQAKEMLDQGLINDSEYETIKARIVASL